MLLTATISMLQIANWFVPSLTLGWALWLRWWSPTSFIECWRWTNFTRAPTGTLLRHAVWRPALFAVRRASSRHWRRTNSPVPLSTDHSANPLIDIWTRLGVQTEYWRARNLERRRRPFQRCTVWKCNNNFISQRNINVVDNYNVYVT